MVNPPPLPDPNRPLRANWKEGEPRIKTKKSHPFLNIFYKHSRVAVSQNRLRSKFQGLDLDLAYITDRIIAMGYPATNGNETRYRNTMVDTIEFLYRRHGNNHVKVFNLRGSFLYDSRYFNGNVVFFEMMDHNPPSLELMAPFCREAKEWLDADPENVIAVHCKAGKGRTGVMICAFLIYIGYYNNPRQILDYYSILRTINNKGVTIPSQRRYIYYFDELRRRKLNYFPKTMQLMAVHLECPPQTRYTESHFVLDVYNNGTRVYEPRKFKLRSAEIRQEQAEWRDRHRMDISNDHRNNSCNGRISNRAYTFKPRHEAFVRGDVRVRLTAKGHFTGLKKQRIGHVWFNTMFVCMENPPPFVYGDEKDPYPEGETSIGRKNLTPDEEWEPYEGTSFRNKPLPNGLKIVKPPGLDRHAPPATIQSVYTKYGMEAPRVKINDILHIAHEAGLVKDDYNVQKNLIPTANTPGKQVVSPQKRDRRLFNSWCPDRVDHDNRDHVLHFPIYEIDNAMKNKRFKDTQMRIIVVLRCIDPIDQEKLKRAEGTCRFYETEEQKNAFEGYEKNEYYRDFKTPGSYPHQRLGAELLNPPPVRYGEGDNYNGAAHPNLHPHAFIDDVRSDQREYYRYFYRQRKDSESKYPFPDRYPCPLVSVSLPGSARRTEPDSVDNIIDNRANASSSPDDYVPPELEDLGRRRNQESSSDQASGSDPTNSPHQEVSPDHQSSPDQQDGPDLENSPVLEDSPDQQNNPVLERSPDQEDNAAQGDSSDTPSSRRDQGQH